MNIYDTFSVRTVINAAGYLTRLGGSVLDSEVIEAMQDAAKYFVRLEDLQDAAGVVIADATGADSGYVTCGASAGLTLAIAACIAGLDVAKMDRLPDVFDRKHEVIVQKAHRNAYDRAVRVAGGSFIEVGTLGFPGAGVTWPWQIEAAISEHTAAVLWPVSQDNLGTVSLGEVCDIAHRHDIPVVVDAAASLPPTSNLRRFVVEGADAVVFSGGKGIGGPQASGIVAAKRNIIDSIALQQQDMDVHPQTWSYRNRFLESGQLPGPPQQGLGRGFKVGKEEIVGLLVALRRFVHRDEAAERVRWIKTIESLAVRLSDLAAVRVDCCIGASDPLPHIDLYIDESQLCCNTFDIINHLSQASPNIMVGQGDAYRRVIGIYPMCLQKGESEIVAPKFREILERHRMPGTARGHR